MFRRLFTFASAMSLLLCVAIVVVWARSYYRFDTVDLGRVETLPDGQRRQVDRFVSTCPSVIYLTWSSFPGRVGVRAWPGDKPPIQFLGFDLISGSQPLWPNATWDSGASRQYYRWKTLRLAWWNTGRLALPGGGWQDNCALIVPDWLLVCVLLVLPILRLRRFRLDRRRQRRQLEHCCPACGYDLRATSDRCPECGTPIQEKVTAS